MSQESPSQAPRPASDLHRWIDHEQVVERYVQNRLEGAELERFEQHYLTCDTCIERLELAERFQSSLRRVVAEEAERATRIAALGWWARQLRRPGAWVAFLLILLLVPSWLAWQLAAERERLEETLAVLRAPTAITTVARLDALRSAAGEAPAVQLLLPDPGESLLLELETEPGGRYDARLIDADAATLWQGTGLVASSAGRLRLVLGSRALRRGIHHLELVRRSDAGDAGQEPLRYAFEVLEAPIATTEPQ